MEVIFVHDHVRYRYGFSTDKDRVRYEWLFAAPKGREKFNFSNESKGTRRLFYLAGLIFHALDHGSALVVDELECRRWWGQACVIVVIGG